VIAICEQRWDVASYALGVLDDAAAIQFEDHLVDCVSCAEELADLLPTVDSLARVDREAFVRDVATQDAFVRDAFDRDAFALDERSWPRSAESPRAAAGSSSAASQSTRPLELVDSIPRVRSARGRDRKRPQRRLLVGVAAVVLMLGGGVGLLVNMRADPARQAVMTGNGTTAVATTGPATGPNVHRAASDPNTGVRLDVVAAGKPYGTLLNFSISDVEGPLRCRLVTVASSGVAEVVGSWSVPPAGYGTPAHPAPLVLQASTALVPASIDQVEVQAIDAAGKATLLVEVPLH
jgi:hypothetical protein